MLGSVRLVAPRAAREVEPPSDHTHNRRSLRSFASPVHLRSEGSAGRSRWRPVLTKPLLESYYEKTSSRTAVPESAYTTGAFGMTSTSFGLDFFWSKPFSHTTYESWKREQHPFPIYPRISILFTHRIPSNKIHGSLFPPPAPPAHLLLPPASVLPPSTYPCRRSASSPNAAVAPPPPMRRQLLLQLPPLPLTAATQTLAAACFSFLFSFFML